MTRKKVNDKVEVVGVRESEYAVAEKLWRDGHKTTIDLVLDSRTELDGDGDALEPTSKVFLFINMDEKVVRGTSRIGSDIRDAVDKALKGKLTCAEAMYPAAFELAGSLVVGESSVTWVLDKVFSRFPAVPRNLVEDYLYNEFTDAGRGKIKVNK